MSPIVYRLLADLIVLFHAAYVLFVVLGLGLILVGICRGWGWVRNPVFRWTHLAMIGVVVLESWVGIMCPLTVWEQRLRELGGQESYRGDFIGNLVHELLFFEAPTWAFTSLYTVFGALVLLAFLAAPPRRAPPVEKATAADPLTPESQRR
jgi:hypothetical protein